MTAFDPDTYTAAADLLRERVILVTGASDGIGRAAAKAFARHGARVILLGRATQKLEALHDEIVADGGERPAITVMDLAKAQGPAYFDLAEQISRQYGRLDGLLHNAAVLGGRSPIEHHDVGVWQEVLHVNLTVPFILTKVLFPSLRQAADASVLFTTSSVGRRGRAFSGAYAVSKFGVEGLAQVLADETRDSTHIRVNCVNPGATRTKMRRSAYPAEDPARLKTPEELMPTYLYLMGTDSAGITGTSIDCQKYISR